jgi:hypothetical protein
VSACGCSFTILGANALSTAHTALCLAASLVGDSPDLTVLSSNWTFHFTNCDRCRTSAIVLTPVISTMQQPHYSHIRMRSIAREVSVKSAI